MVAPPLAFVDAETVRISSRQGSALWEVAVVLPVAGAPDEEYLWQVRPRLHEADAGSARIGRYYQRCQVADKPAGSGKVLVHPKQPKGKTAARAAHLIALDLARLLDGRLIGGANPWFDFDHIDAFLREHDQCLTADYHMRDIGSVISGYLSGYDVSRRNCEFCKHEPREPAEQPSSPRLTDIARAMGFNPDSWDTHTALGDARLARALWKAASL